MHHYKIRPRDRAWAEIQTLGSRFASHSPKLGAQVRGDQQAQYIPLRWFHARQTVSSIRGWLEFAPDDSGGRLPRNYRGAATILLETAALDGYLNNYPDGREAVAYRLGKTAVMVGTHPAGADIFSDSLDGSSQLAIAMRIGRGPLQAVAGLWSPQSGFITNPDLISAGSVQPLADLPAGVKFV